MVVLDFGLNTGFYFFAEKSTSDSVTFSSVTVSLGLRLYYIFKTLFRTLISVEPFYVSDLKKKKCSGFTWCIKKQNVTHYFMGHFL